MSDQIHCRTCGHAKAEHNTEFIGMAPCSIPSCDCCDFINPSNLYKSWDEAGVALDQPVDKEE